MDLGTKCSWLRIVTSGELLWTW